MKSILASFAIALAAASAAHAAPISGTGGVPTVPGANTTIDFDGLPVGAFASMTLGGVTFSGTNDMLRAQAQSAGTYNTRGTGYLDNMFGRTGFHFGFAAPVNGFAFHFGTSLAKWTLTAFDASGATIESHVLKTTGLSNSGNYFGISNSGIAYATLTQGASTNSVRLDNFVVAQAQTNDVPEPASLALLGLGLAAIGALKMRRKS